MYFTPRTKRKDTTTTDFSTNVSRISKISKRLTTQQSFNLGNANHNEQNQEIEKLKPIAKISIEVKKQKLKSPNKSSNLCPITINHQKYKINIVSRMSSQQHGNIISYGVSTFKGHNHVINPHFLAINLGSVKNILLAESFDGTTAAKLIRQNFPLQLIDLSLKSEYKDPENMIHEAYRRVQKKISARQSQMKDNSGSCFLSIIIRRDLVFVSNAGCSQAICGTKNGSVLRLSDGHTTKNVKQVKRIVKNGGSLYQTIVNVPFQQDLQVKGPMRLAPCGLVYTRCMGRAFDFNKLNQNNNDLQSLQQPPNLTWRPQIKFIKTSQVVWLGVFSQSVLNNCSIQFIQDTVDKQMKHKSQTFNQHHIAIEISKKIANHIISKGVPDAITAIILFLSNLKEQSQSKCIQTGRNSIKTFNLSNNFSSNQNERRINSSSSSKKSSLTYLGNRKSFVKQIDENCKNLSLTKIMKIEHSKKERQLKKDFSFNTFY